MVEGGVRCAEHFVGDSAHGNVEARRGVAFWTDWRISQLTILWADGYSATRIAQEFGCTRNSVVGKIWRLKLPNPLIKQNVIRDRVYANQLPAETREASRISQKARRHRKRAEKRGETVTQFWAAVPEDKAITRAQFRANGASPYSAAYRKHMPRVGEMTKGELRAMLAQAMQNTAAMPCTQ